MYASGCIFRIHSATTELCLRYFLVLDYINSDSNNFITPLTTSSYPGINTYVQQTLLFDFQSSNGLQRPGLTHCTLVTPYGDIELGQQVTQVMACCLMAPSHYLNQCLLIICKVQWHSGDGNFTKDTSVTNLLKLALNYWSIISFKSPRGQWAKNGVQGK